MNSTALTARSTVGEWLEDPRGGQIFRDLLARGGQDEKSLRPVRLFPLQNLVSVSRGRFPEELVVELMRRTYGDQPRGELGIAAADEPGTGAREDVPHARFVGQTVIVTGAGSGIGRATALRIAREGGRVVAVDIAGDRLDEVVAEGPADLLEPVVADISTDAQVERIVQAAGSRIDGLANVAGVMDDMTPLHEVSDRTWQRVFGVNVEGTFKLSRAVLPVMLEGRSGSIVNVASEAALRGNAAGAAYTASKHAVVGLTRSSAFMYGPLGIRTNAVAPGPVATGIESAFGSQYARERLGEFMALIPPVAQAEQVAASIAWLLSGDSSNVNGVVLPSDGGWAVQ